MKHFWTITLVLSFVSSTAAAANAREDDVREAVCRWYVAPLFPELRPAYPQAEVYFLAVSAKNEDPSDEFLKRFSTGGLSLRRRSDCRILKNGEVVDRKTGEHGVILRLGRIRWLTDKEAMVHAEYDADGRRRMVYTCTVISESGKWRVVRDVRGAREEILLANKAGAGDAGQAPRFGIARGLHLVAVRPPDTSS